MTNPIHGSPYVTGRKKIFLSLSGVGGGGLFKQYKPATASAQVQLFSIGGSAQLLVASDTNWLGYDFDGEGEDATLLWRVPHDCDVSSDIWVYGVLKNDAANPSITLRCRYAAIAVGEATAAATTALDTAWSAISGTSADDVIRRTSQGIINGGTVSADDFMAFGVDCTAVTSDGVQLLGLEIHYFQKNFMG